MIATPGEAKFKYCPYLTTHDDKLKFCQTTMCMMWCFVDPEKTSDDSPGYCGLTNPQAMVPTQK